MISRSDRVNVRAGVSGPGCRKELYRNDEGPVAWCVATEPLTIT